MDNINVNRKVSIQWKINNSAFRTVNMKTLVGVNRKIGSSRSGVNKMLANSAEQEAIMPNILGADPKSPSANWNKLLADYWNSLSIDIPYGGKELETGWVFNFYNPKKESAIEKLSDKVKSVKDSDSLAKHVMSKIPEEQKYLYGDPISPQDYMLWRYCLVYRDVANDFEDVDKSGHIRFYLIEEGQLEIKRKAKFVTKKISMEEFIKLADDSDKVENILYIAISDGKVPRPDNSLTALDDTDKLMKLEALQSEEPDYFVSLCKDKHLTTKALIEKYVFFNIFRKLPNTSIIVDATDPGIVIGNSIDEAISFVTNEVNSNAMKEYSARYKGLPKT